MAGSMQHEWRLGNNSASSSHLHAFTLRSDGSEEAMARVPEAQGALQAADVVPSGSSDLQGSQLGVLLSFPNYLTRVLVIAQPDEFCTIAWFFLSCGPESRHFGP
jgi:hypothetical protein